MAKDKEFNILAENMRHLMFKGSRLDKDIVNKSLFTESITYGSDSKIYGIVKEGEKYFIKSGLLPNGKRIDESDFTYIGGYKNKLNERYKNYDSAKGALTEKMIELKETYGEPDDIKLEDYLPEDEIVSNDMEFEDEKEEVFEDEDLAGDDETSEMEAEPSMEDESEEEVEEIDDSLEDVSLDDEMETSEEEVSEEPVGDEGAEEEMEDLSDEGDTSEEVEDTEVVVDDAEGETASEETVEDDQPSLASLSGQFSEMLKDDNVDLEDKKQSINQFLGNLVGILTTNNALKDEVVAKMDEIKGEIESEGDETVEETNHLKEGLINKIKESKNEKIIKLKEEMIKRNLIK